PQRAHRPVPLAQGLRQARHYLAQPARPRPARQPDQRRADALARRSSSERELIGAGAAARLERPPAMSASTSCPGLPSGVRRQLRGLRARAPRQRSPHYPAWLAIGGYERGLADGTIELCAPTEPKGPIDDEK